MLLFFKSFMDTFSTLSWVDIVFFLAVMFLIILVVTLIYFIIINDEEETKEPQKNPITEETKKEEAKPMLFEDPNEEGELLDLKTLTKRLEEKESNPIAMNDYEEEQEQKAIISYDELLEKHQDFKINYEEEQQVGDITIKKVDLDNISTPIEKTTLQKPRVIGYEKEEAFLEALKKLQEQIN